MTAAAARLRASLPLLPALVVLAVWLPSLGAGFQFDDYADIVDDPSVQSLGAWWHSLPDSRPLLTLSYALCHAAGFGAAGFRAVNILLHAFNASLVFVLFRRLARRLRVADESGAALLAATTALVFALHPAQTESVTYVSGRPNVLMASCVLLGLLGFTGRSAAGSRLRRMLAQAAVVAGVALGILVTATAAVAPLALCLLVACEHGRRSRDVLCAAAPALLVAAGLAGASLMLSMPVRWPALGLDLAPPWSALMTQARGIGWLTGQVLLVDPLNADPQLAPVVGWDASAFFTGLALVALLVLALTNLKKRPGLALGVLWCLLWLVASIGLITRPDVAHDRQLYLPLMGLGWLLGLALLRVPALLHDFSVRMRTTLLGVVSVVLAAGTLVRNDVYQTEVAFWQDVVFQSPENARAQIRLGRAHAQACEPFAARSAFERAIVIAPHDAQGQMNLALLEQGALPGMPALPACR